MNMTFLTVSTSSCFLFSTKVGLGRNNVALWHFILPEDFCVVSNNNSFRIPGYLVKRYYFLISEQILLYKVTCSETKGDLCK